MYKFIALFKPQDIVVDEWCKGRDIGKLSRWRETV